MDVTVAQQFCLLEEKFEIQKQKNSLYSKSTDQYQWLHHHPAAGLNKYLEKNVKFQNFVNDITKYMGGPIFVFTDKSTANVTDVKALR